MIETIIVAMLIFVMVSGVLIGFIAALALYKNAPERKDMGFNKYWNALMLDTNPGDASILKFEGERLDIFLLYKKIHLSAIILVGVLVVSLVLAKSI